MSEIPNWQIIKLEKGESLQGVHIDLTKRVLKFDPEKYWVRYEGTKEDPIIHVYSKVEP